MKGLKKLILASASPRRKELLLQIGLVPEIVPPDVEETISTSDPKQAVMELSRQKAEGSACTLKEGMCILGADTVVAIENRILGKPSGHEDAYRMISLLAGKTHQVYTGVTLVFYGKEGKQIRTFAEKTDVCVFPMSEEEIRIYADSEEPLDKAGAYGIQGEFAAFIQGISGDYNNVVGLPVSRVYQELKRLLKQEKEGKS